jgi:hypothetical protein
VPHVASHSVPHFASHSVPHVASLSVPHVASHSVLHVASHSYSYRCAVYATVISQNTCDGNNLATCRSRYCSLDLRRKNVISRWSSSSVRRSVVNLCCAAEISTGILFVLV